MKTLFLLIPLLFCLSANATNVLPDIRPALPAAEPAETMIAFYNEGEKPQTDPYLVIVFYNMPLEKIPETSQLTAAIHRKMENLGGIKTKEDYEVKLMPALTEYRKRFVKLGALKAELFFPKKKELMVYFDNSQ